MTNRFAIALSLAFALISTAALAQATPAPAKSAAATIAKPNYPNPDEVFEKSMTTWVAQRKACFTAAGLVEIVRGTDGKVLSGEFLVLPEGNGRMIVADRVFFPNSTYRRDEVKKCFVRKPVQE